MERQKTLSKHFYNDEIICKLSDGTIYLKEGVRRKPVEHPEYEEFEDTVSHINEYARRYETLLKAKKIIEEERDFDN